MAMHKFHELFYHQRLRFPKFNVSISMLFIFLLRGKRRLQLSGLFPAHSVYNAWRLQSVIRFRSLVSPKGIIKAAYHQSNIPWI
jgi:hypothetical protein